jgi:hypothetical protein
VGSEVDVNWIDTHIVELVGICVGGAGLVLYALCARRRMRIPGQAARVAMPRRLESVGELWGLAILFGGLALSQVAIVAGYVRFGTTPPRLTHALAVAGGSVLLWGISIGRLSLRRQLRIEAATASAPSAMATKT